MGYSKMTSIELINFMSFKQAKLVFDETGILNIKGYNDSGKSAILRALAVCLMDDFKRNQVKLIRFGEEYFRIVVNFDDGISILRDKYSNGQSLYEVYKNEELVFTTKQGNKLSKVDGVPEVISDYLGLCVTDSVNLNYQSCVDALPLVDKRGSENYQMLHEVLRMEEIYRANNMINTDKNELGSRQAEIEWEIQRNKVLLSNLGDIDESLIDRLDELDAECSIDSDKEKKLQSLVSIIESIESFKDIPEISSINYERFDRVSRLVGVLAKYSDVKEIPEVKAVDTSRVFEVSNIIAIVRKLSDFQEIPEVPVVDVGLLGRDGELSKISSSFVFYCKVVSEMERINLEIKKVKHSLDGIALEAEKNGVNIIRCENCGSYILAGGEHKNE